MVSDEILDRDRLDGLVKKIRIAPRTFAVLVGAGVSKPAGIPLAGEIVEMLEHAKVDDLTKQSPGLTEEQAKEILKEQGYFRDPAHVYSDSIRLVHATRDDRQKFFDSLIHGKQPTLAHRFLAKLVKDGFVDTIFTTNFDDLMEKALRDTNVRFRSVSHDELAHYADIRGDYPNVIKLHGDYLYTNIKNLTEESARLSKEMERLFTGFLSQYGLIVVGFGGFDSSVMKPLEQIANPAFLKKGLYWTYRHSPVRRFEPNPLLQRILDRGAGNVVLLGIEDADSFFKTLCEGVFGATTERREVIAEPLEVHVSGICIREGENGLEVLLGRRSVGKHLYPNLWHCGGGALRVGENFVEAVIRECRTEFGVDVEPLAPIRTYEIAVPQLPQKKIPGVVFLCQVMGYTSGSEPKADGTDVVDWKWQPISKIGDLEMIPTVGEDIRMASDIYDTLHSRHRSTTTESLAVHAAAICLRRSGNKIEVLLAKRSSDRVLYPGLWDGGGGIVLHGESFEEAVTREIKEEVGAIIKPVVPINTYFLEDAGGVPGVVFLCEVLGYVFGNGPTPDLEEVTDCRWVPVNDLAPFEFVPGVLRDIELAVRLFSSLTE